MFNKSLFDRCLIAIKYRNSRSVLHSISLLSPLISSIHFTHAVSHFAEYMYKLTESAITDINNKIKTVLVCDLHDDSFFEKISLVTSTSINAVEFCLVYYLMRLNILYKVICTKFSFNKQKSLSIHFSNYLKYIKRVSRLVEF